MGLPRLPSGMLVQPVQLNEYFQKCRANLTKMKSLLHLFRQGEAYSSGVGLADRTIRQIVLGLKIGEFSTCWTY